MKSDESVRNVNEDSILQNDGRRSETSAGATAAELHSQRHFHQSHGMDTVSATASIAGLLAIATALVKGTYTLAQSAKDFRSELTTIAGEVAQLLGVLHALKSSFGQPESPSVHSPQYSSGEVTPQSNAALTPPQPTTPDSDKEYEVLSVGRTRDYLSVQLSSEICTCQITLVELDRMLSQSNPTPGSPIANVTKKFRWSFKKPDLDRLIQKLERHKSTFVLILSSQGTEMLREEVEAAKAQRDIYREDLEYKTSESGGRACSRYGTVVPREQNVSAVEDGEVVTDSLVQRRRAAIIDHLETTMETTCALAYVYFDYNDRVQSPANVLSSLLKQLLRQIGSKPWPKELFQKLQTKSSDACTSTLDSREVIRLMRHCLEQFSIVYLIFDALDECEDPTRTKFLTFIMTTAKMEHRLRILFTSRPQLPLNDGLNVIETIVIYAQQTDIEAYIRSSIEHKCYKQSLQEEIVRKLLEKADGLFLLAKLHLSYILRQFTTASIKKALEHLPPDLDLSYQDSLARIQRRGEEAQQLASKVFAWIIHSHRSLTVAEILDALSVEEWSAEHEPDNQVELHIVLDCCMGLVTIHNGTDTIRFSHYTVQKYLMRQSGLIPSPLYLANVCLTYLLFENVGTALVDPGHDAQENGLEYLQTHPFLQYAAQNWLVHVKGEGEQDSKTLDHLKRLFTTKSKFDFMLRVRRAGSQHRNGDPNSSSQVSSPLHVAARAGLSSVVALLLSGNWGPDVLLPRTDAEGRTALHEASVGGDPEIVAQLIKWDCNVVDRQDDCGRTALHLAAQNGNTEVVRMLLKHHANPRIKDNFGRDVLYVALAWREEETARIIFDTLFEETMSTSADAGAAYFGWYPDDHTLLHQAAHLGYDKAVERLLEAGADPHAMTSLGLTPLYFAARKGHGECVRILLRAMDNDIKPTLLRDTPLHRAAKWGREEAVQILIDADGSLGNVKDFLGFTALHWATAGGHLGIVKKLLSKTEIWLPAEVDVPSLFQLALWGGYEDVLYLLLEFYASKGYVCPVTVFNFSDLSDIIQRFDRLMRGFRVAKDFEIPIVLTGGIELCSFYGLMQMKRGRLEMASAWLDIALILNPGNTTIRNPDKLICHRKYCDYCTKNPIEGPYYTCTLCVAPCYDLCTACFGNRSEINHPHDQYMKVPSSLYPIPTLGEHLDRLRASMEREIPLNIGKGKFKGSDVGAEVVYLGKENII